MAYYRRKKYTRRYRRKRFGGKKDYAFRKAKRAAKSVLWKNAETKKVVTLTTIGIPTGVVWRIHVQNVFSGFGLGTGADDMVGNQIQTRLMKLNMQLYQWGTAISANTLVEIALVVSKDQIVNNTIVDNNTTFPGAIGSIGYWWDGRAAQASWPAVPFNLWTYNRRCVKVIKMWRYNMITPSDQGGVSGVEKRDMRLKKFKCSLKGKKIFSGINPDLLQEYLDGWNYYIVTRLHKPTGSTAYDNFEINYTKNLYYKDV